MLRSTFVVLVGLMTAVVLVVWGVAALSPTPPPSGVYYRDTQGRCYLGGDGDVHPTLIRCATIPATAPVFPRP